MKNKNRMIELITSITILLPILIGIFLWNRLPEQMPIHYDINGNPDNYAGKAFAVFVMPVVLLMLQWICIFAASKQKDSLNAKMKQLVLWIIPIISIFVSFIMYRSALGNNTKVLSMVFLFMGLLFIIVGNYLPKCRQNYTIGIKIPWTLNSEENWNRTHRLGGIVWIVGGMLLLLNAFWVNAVLSVIVIVLLVAVPLVYSGILYHKGI